jgi:hypothetical protein
MTAPPTWLGLTRWEFVEGGVSFRLWARPIIDDSGARVVPVTLVWRTDDGAGGVARCSGMIDAMEGSRHRTGRKARFLARTENSGPLMMRRGWCASA